MTFNSSSLFLSKLALRNLRMMHLLERLAHAFQEARVPVMALKGAALNLTLYERPDERPMDDLDLLVQPSNLDAAKSVLEKLGGVPGQPAQPHDFFPRFHYETEYQLGSLHRVKVDLHVRPFRPMRYGRTVPDEALWDRAAPRAIGRSNILIPSTENMLIHLSVHAAVHGFSRPMWLEDVRRWIIARRHLLDGDEFLEHVEAWRLVLPVREAFARLDAGTQAMIPPKIGDALSAARTSWRDRKALAHAPHDAERPLGHVVTNVLCTPDPRFVGSYLHALMMPDRTYMGDWYPRRHLGWLPIAHLLRWTRPMVAHLPRWGGTKPSAARE